MSIYYNGFGWRCIELGSGDVGIGLCGPAEGMPCDGVYFVALAVPGAIGSPAPIPIPEAVDSAIVFKSLASVELVRRQLQDLADQWPRDLAAANAAWVETESGSEAGSATPSDSHGSLLAHPENESGSGPPETQEDRR